MHGDLCEPLLAKLTSKAGGVGKELQGLEGYVMPVVQRHIPPLLRNRERERDSHPKSQGGSNVRKFAAVAPGKENLPPRGLKCMYPKPETLTQIVCVCAYSS